METPQTHFLSGQKVVVVGAGIAGLSFAIALRRLWDPALEPADIRIYDRDSRHMSPGRNGYAITLSGLDGDSGLVACRDLGVLEAVLGRAGASADDASLNRIWDANWVELVRVRLRPHAALPTSSTSITRMDLREVLVAAAEDMGIAIEWDTACRSAERLADGRVRVHLPGGAGAGPARTDDCDLLIAADGAHSKIRASFRPDDGLRYTRTELMGGVGRFADGIPAPLDGWGTMVSGRGIGFFFGPIGRTDIIWVLSRLMPERPKHSDFDVLEREREHLVGILGTPLASAIEATDRSTFFVMPTYEKEPFAHDGAGLRNVVYIGDSNHAGSPVAGSGANLALRDGWELAARLCDSASLGEAIVAYDGVAFPRAFKKLKEARRRTEMVYRTGIRYHVWCLLLRLMGWLTWLMRR